MTIKIIYTVFLLIVSVVLYAQNAAGIKHIEEVKNMLAVSAADSNRVLLIADLCELYQWNNIDSLKYYSLKGIELAQELNFTRGEVRILNSQAIAYLFRGDVPKALNILYPALKLAEKYNYKMETAISLNNIGSCYFFLNDLDRSLAFLRRAVEINKRVPDLQKDVYWNLYIDFWIGTVYIDVNKYDSAKFYINKVYKGASDPRFTDPNSLRPTILMFYGYLYLKQDKLDSAYYYLNQAISIFSVYNDVFGGSDAYTYMAMVYRKKNQPDSVIYYAKKGLELSLSKDYKTSTLNTSRILAEQYENSDPGLALKYLKIQLAMNDSLYGAKKIQDLQRTLAEVQQQEQAVREEQIIKQNEQKQNAFLVGLGVLLIIAFILFRNNRQRKKANVLLEQQKDKVEITLSELKATQSQLIQSEKMASLGELTAGIAHEIQNPLNFVNNFSDVSEELVAELSEELNQGDIGGAKLLSDDIAENLKRIKNHGQRASEIVKSMLLHSRTSAGEKEPTDINALCDEYLRLSYHGMRAKDKSFNAEFKLELDPVLPKVNVVPQDIGKVLLNLINNAFYAINEKEKRSLLLMVGTEDGRQKTIDRDYKPEVKVSTRKLDGKIEIRVNDNGPGIPEHVRDKIFQPFFTTKPTGQGTGLGLSLSYDIVKAHGGSLNVVSIENIGTEFILEIPISLM